MGLRDRLFSGGWSSGGAPGETGDAAGGAPEDASYGAADVGEVGRGSRKTGFSRLWKKRGEKRDRHDPERAERRVSSENDVLMRAGAGAFYGLTDRHLETADGFNELHAPINVGVREEGTSTARRAMDELQRNGRLDSETAEVVLKIVEQERARTHAAIETQYVVLRDRIALAEARAMAVRLEELPRRAEEIRERLAEIESERSAGAPRSAVAGGVERRTRADGPGRAEAPAHGRAGAAGDPAGGRARRAFPGSPWGRGAAADTDENPIDQDVAAAVASA